MTLMLLGALSGLYLWMCLLCQFLLQKTLPSHLCMLNSYLTPAWSEALIRRWTLIMQDEHNSSLGPIVIGYEYSMGARQISRDSMVLQSNEGESWGVGNSAGAPSLYLAEAVGGGAVGYGGGTSSRNCSLTWNLETSWFCTHPKLQPPPRSFPIPRTFRHLLFRCSFIPEIVN